jgi:hypothetical protein
MVAEVAVSTAGWRGNWPNRMAIWQRVRLGDLEGGEGEMSTTLKRIKRACNAMKKGREFFVTQWRQQPDGTYRRVREKMTLKQVAEQVKQQDN